MSCTTSRAEEANNTSTSTTEFNITKTLKEITEYCIFDEEDEVCKDLQSEHKKALAQKSDYLFIEAIQKAIQTNKQNVWISTDVTPILLAWKDIILKFQFVPSTSVCEKAKECVKQISDLLSEQNVENYGYGVEGNNVHGGYEQASAKPDPKTFDIEDFARKNQTLTVKDYLIATLKKAITCSISDLNSEHLMKLNLNAFGVYALYYCGNTPLYGVHHGDSTKPIYIGMTDKQSLKMRLVRHRALLKLAGLEKDIKFTVIPTTHDCARSCEIKLIEGFKPLWNSETFKISFGNGSAEKNMWNLYHVVKDEDTTKQVNKFMKEKLGTK